MPPGTIKKQLDGVGRKVSWWRAQLKMLVGIAGVTVCVFLLGLADLWLQYGRVSRIVIWSCLVAISCLILWWVKRTLSRRFNIMAVAAMMEKSFPQLDNHLINYLQFSANPGDDPFKRAYVRFGAPKWSGFNLTEMKNRKRHKHATYAVLLAALLLAAPGAFLGQAWGIAVWRVVNPFSNTMPMALTHILDVQPGDSTVAQGKSLVLSCTVQGYEGHRVSVDIDPADGDKVTYSLGKIKGKGEEKFTYRIPKVNTKVKYRFMAGDAPFPAEYTIETRPPLGFEKVKIEVTPPVYTKLSSKKYDIADKDIAVPAGSLLEVNFVSNIAVTNAILLRGGESHPMKSTGDPTKWKGELIVASGVPVRLSASSEWGDDIEQWLELGVQEDQIPIITVISPEGKPTLPPGTTPTISFEVTDEFGLTEVQIEQVSAGGTSGGMGQLLKTWKVGGAKSFVKTWDDAGWRSRDKNTFAYRIVARDNCDDGNMDRIARSTKIIFNSMSNKDLNKKRNSMEAQDSASIARVIEMQKENLSMTESYQKLMDSTKPDAWKSVSAVQVEIRKIMKGLLGSPINSLGNLTAVSKKLYLNEMHDVIPLLKNIPKAAGADRENRVARAITMEKKILRQLTFAEVASAKAKVQRRISALTGLIERMIREESSIMKMTQSHIDQDTQVPASLTDRQDKLGVDITDFIQACKTESAEVVGNDHNFAKLLLDVAKACDTKKVREDAMLAAEQLDDNSPAKAMLFEVLVHDKLEAIQRMLDEVLAEDQLMEQELLLEAVLEAKERIEKIKDVHLKAVENMDKVKDQLDKSNKEIDKMEEEFQEIVKNTEEAMLQVPTDLNIFMELNVANDIIEDVFSVFEECKQKAGSEKMGAGDVAERALGKREEYLEGMEEAKDRMDALEGWLMDHPDNLKVTTEAFDQEEMPGAGMSLGALTTEAEDLIGDLMEKEDDMSEAADDGAINTAVPDTVPSAEVKEGDVTSFGAQGKSSNEEPDHKEQDGRSNIGRQGMSTGETAAGSGTVGEGDKNIEERRTQDPTQSGQVDLDGDVDTKATGGGKLATGKADGLGMNGGTKRMDSEEVGSMDGLEELMKEQADSLYAKASAQNLRSGSLKKAAHHLRQASDAVAKGNIGQLKEHRRMAMVELKRAQAEIDAAKSGSFTVRENPSIIDDAIEGGAEEAPPKYKDMVSEYYKQLNTAM